VLRISLFLILLLIAAGCVTVGGNIAEVKQQLIAESHDQSISRAMSKKSHELLASFSTLSTEQLGSSDSKPARLISSGPPEYPLSLKRQNIQGIAWIGFVVDEQGNVAKVEVLSASTSVFGALTKSAALKWKFQPATYKGLPVTSVLTTSMTYLLD
jgi:TonB family protein